MMAPGESTGYELTLSRRVSARREQVFRALTDRDVVARWLCHDGDRNKVRIIKFDLRVTGGFRLEMTRAPEVYLVFGTFAELAPPDRLAFDWAWERVIPDMATSQGPTRVTLQLVEKDGATDLLLTQGAFPTEALRDGERDNWNASFAALEKVLASEPPAVR